MEQWDNVSSSGYVASGTVVLLASQFVLRRVFGLQKFKVYSLVLWGIVDLLLIAFAMYIAFGPELHTLKEKFLEYLITLKFVGLIIAGPYTAFIWYLWLRQKIASIKVAQNNTLASPSNSGDQLLTIMGENEKVILAIKYQQLLFVKSAGNYLELYYLKGEKMAKELVRERLKELEKKIGATNVVKVHRSYLVNVRHISSLKKTRKSYELMVQHIPDIIIPVSSGFKQSFEEALKQKVPH